MKWKCAKCKKNNIQTDDYHKNLGLYFSLNKEKNICIKCYNGGRK